MRPGQLFVYTGILLSLWLGTVGNASAFEDAELHVIVRNVPRAELVGDAPGVWMAREKVVRLDGGGGATSTEHLIARVLDPAWGRSEFGPFTVDYWSENQTLRVLRARVWRPDLTFEPLPREAVTDEVSPMAEGRPPLEQLRRLSIEFPEAKAGDVYEILLAKERRPRPGETNVQWFTETFGADVPVIEHKLELQTPRALGTAMEAAGPPLMQGRGKADSFQSQIFLTGNLPPFPAPAEGGMFSRRATALSEADSVSSVALSTVSWSYLSSYLGRQWWILLQDLSPELSREVGRVFSGSVDPAWRAEQLGAWVRDEFETLPISDLLRNGRALSPGQVFEAGGGGPIDKAMLLTASLRLAGVGATPVLVRSYPGPWAENVACPDQLDRILVRAELPEPIWLDPVDDQPLPPGKGFIISVFDPRDEAREDVEASPRAVGLIDFPGRP